jgi:hypothetical protein
VDSRSDLAEVLQPTKSWLFVLLSETGPNDAFTEQLADLLFGHVSFIGSVDEKEYRTPGRFPIARGSAQRVDCLLLKPRAKALGWFPGWLLPEVVFHI